MQLPLTKPLVPHFLTGKLVTKKPTPSPTAKRAATPLHLLMAIADPMGGASRLMAVRLKEHLIVGRSSTQSTDPGNLDIDFASLDATNCGVSRQHAMFIYKDGILELEDLRSTNGTRINGFQIQPGRRYRLRNGDELEFGRMHMIVKIVRAP